ncbi:TetR/AcrR family transcriptional regulator [Mycobacterium sp.]|uniref:TetR/AcrR family transcriptional regulator n=1 Tax=Mycobacterium sp. TaxID=1785 RepID=UPI00257A90A0|nr:TetR/AcrR family transcriptional regulator [Mycobacterium sp.]
MTSASTAKATRVTKRRAETRGRLIDAAIDVFAEKGYGQVTIRDVCTAAGYTRGAFYSQFESLEELLFVIYHQWTTQIADQVRGAVEAGDPVNDLPAIIARIVETLLLEREWLLIKADLLAVAARNPALAQRWSVHRGKLRVTTRNCLPPVAPGRTSRLVARAIRPRPSSPSTTVWPPSCCSKTTRVQPAPGSSRCSIWS